MSAAISPFEATCSVRTKGAARLTFVRDGSLSRLDKLYHAAPLRVLFPRPHDPGVPTAVLVTTSGGLVGGDCLDIAVVTCADARALVTTQAAEKIYRSAAQTCHVRVLLDAGSNSWLEWLPNETIVFDAARLRRTTRVSLDEAAGLLAGEIVVFGRRARGERLASGLVHDAWEIRRNGRLVWTDAFRLDRDLTEVQASVACLDGAAAAGTIVCFAASPRDILALVRGLGEELERGDIRIGTPQKFARHLQ
ncbi:urease accessory protein UreD [Thiocapsa sp.]|uniref:urease accessory protein UreD n=1 Tax=Thiocapsa sp. TaxID=2024551 RepID=UPI00359335FA